MTFNLSVPDMRRTPTKIQKCGPLSKKKPSILGQPKPVKEILSRLFGTLMRTNKLDPIICASSERVDQVIQWVHKMNQRFCYSIPTDKGKGQIYKLRKRVNLNHKGQSYICDIAQYLTTRQNCAPGIKVKWFLII